VGKTTMSAAMSLAWARAGARVVVVTIDPAQRLADSLGMEIGNQPREISLGPLGGSGSLHAMMLDTQATFDALIEQFSASPEVATQIRENRYYHFASARLGGAHEYMAAEKVRELTQSGAFDIVVVDTPPTRNALDFLTAPDRLGRLMDGAVMRWIAMPATRSGWRALELGSEAAARVLRRLVGRGTIGEIAQFFELFRGLWDGFHARSLEVHQMLRDPRTQFLLVTTPAPSARTEALYFLEKLQAEQMPFGGFIVNRYIAPPQHTLDPAALPADGPLPPERWAAVLDAVREAPARAERIAHGQQQSIAALRAAAPPSAPCWTVPDQGEDLHDLAALSRLEAFLPAASEL
jgi:anion-transporting  ArsA/GET3 family ATPase